MQSLQQIAAAFDALSFQQQLELWDEFLRAVDFGDQGCLRFFRHLNPLWEAGLVPAEVYEFAAEVVPATAVSEDDYPFFAAPPAGWELYGEPPF